MIQLRVLCNASVVIASGLKEFELRYCCQITEHLRGAHCQLLLSNFIPSTAVGTFVRFRTPEGPSALFVTILRIDCVDVYLHNSRHHAVSSVSVSVCEMCGDGHDHPSHMLGATSALFQGPSV